jgi:hypothetical protein
MPYAAETAAYVETGSLSEGRIGHVIGTSFSVLVVSPAVRALLDPAAPALFHVAELPGAILVRADLRARLEALDGAGEFVEVEDFTWGLV